MTKMGGKLLKKIIDMKNILTMLMLIFCRMGMSDTVPYTQDNVKLYLQSSELVAMVYKVGGELSFDEYFELLSNSIDENPEHFYERWKKKYKSD